MVILKLIYQIRINNFEKRTKEQEEDVREENRFHHRRIHLHALPSTVQLSQNLPKLGRHPLLVSYFSES